MKRLHTKKKAFTRKQFLTLCLLGMFLLSLLLSMSFLREAQQLKQFAAGGSYFSTLPPGSVLPSDADCAARVRRNTWEPRTDNTTANQTNVYLQGARLTGSYLAQYGYESRVTGNFTGTTDEIIQWGACKWGFDEDTVRAVAVIESYWHQSQLGDCSGTTQPQTNGCASVGLLQVKGANIPPTHPGTWPYAMTSTAFNVDYTLAVRRACFEGKETWLGNGYKAGDDWGCIGRWYSGDWYGSSQNYISTVQNYYNTKPWVAWGYPGVTGGTPQGTVPPTITPTLPPSVTPSPTSSTRVSVILKLHGIGTGGDSINPSSTGNTTPLHPNRTVTLVLTDVNNVTLPGKTGTVAYQAATGDFRGTIDLGNILGGYYMGKFQVPSYLPFVVNGFISVSVGQTITLSPVSLVSGDTNTDGRMDILDYNLLLDCYSDFAPARSCDTTKKGQTDITDDGSVNSNDLNLFLREMSVRQ